MSNPFRRPQAPTFDSRDTPPTLGGSQVPTLPTDLNASFTSRSSADLIPADPPVPSPKVKKVRITSPPRSPPPDSYGPTEHALLRQQLVVTHHSSSVSPQKDEDSSSSEDGGSDDPFAREQSSEEELPVESVHRQPITPHSTRLNPFSRTSTTTEESKRPPVRKDRRNVGSGEGRAGTKTPMDVDSFKNLLMTGKATASAQSKVLASLQADSSSSTDTSSISRQSLFEPLQEPHGETPRTSYELSVSEDDDGSTLIAETSKTDKPKPPPPKHRHGKVVAPKGPQTVAFDDFSPTFASPSTQSLPTTVSSPSPVKDSLSRALTDSNKPLPRPPLRTSSDESRPLPFDLQLSTRRPSLPQQSSSDPLTAKKIPPAPPLARRSSLMRSNTLPHRRRSNTQTTEDAPPSPNIADTHNPSTAKNAPPPPPPTRRSRAGTGTMDPSPSVEIPDSQDGKRNMVKPAHTPSRQAPHPQQSGSSLPPPPPRRASTRSSADFGNPNTSSSPPGSGRPSAEMTRMNFEVETGGTEEVDREALKQEREIDSVAKPTTDVLADMEAFQREIDELRERYDKGGGLG